jgi:hypothetical protein
MAGHFAASANNTFLEKGPAWLAALGRGGPRINSNFVLIDAHVASPLFGEPHLHTKQNYN